MGDWPQGSAHKQRNDSENENNGDNANQRQGRTHGRTESITTTLMECSGLSVSVT